MTNREPWNNATRRIPALKIGPRLALGFLLVIILMASMNGILLWQLQVIRAQTAHVGSIDEKLIAVLRVHTNLLSFYDRLQDLVQAEDSDRMATEAESLRARLAVEGALAGDALGRLPPAVQLDTTTRLTLDAIQRSLESQLHALTELANHGDWDGVRLRLSNEIRPLQSVTSRLVADVSGQVGAERAEAFVSIGDADRRIIMTVSIVGVLTVLIAGILGLVLTRSITEPLGRLMQGSHALARGDFEHRVSVQGADELAHLGRVFNETAGQLRVLYETLRTSEAYLTEAQRLSATGSFGWEVSTGKLFWSEETYRLVGLERGSQPTLDEVLRRVHPDDVTEVRETLHRATAERAGLDFEHRLRMSDGSVRHVRVVARIVEEPRGGLEYVGAVTDVTALRRSETVLAAEKRLLEMIASGCTLPSFLDSLCLCVEGVAPGCLCSVLLVDPDGQRVRTGAGPSLPSSYNEAIDGRPVNREAGPCGMAAFLREQVIVEDIASDTRWDAYEWRTLALAHGLRACWSTPVVAADGRVLGTFALSFRHAGRPTPDQRALIEQFTHVARIAIEKAQTEEALRRSERYLAEAQRLTHTGSYAWNVATGELIHWSREVYRLWGFDPDAGIPKFETVRDRIHPADRAAAVEALDRTTRSGIDNEIVLRAVHPDGSVKYIHSVGHANLNASGEVVEVVGTNMDITERRQAQEALEETRAELAHVARVATLGELTASIAHEVNQPLSGIMTNASTCLRLLAAQHPDLEEAAATARRTLRDAKRAAEVITRLRDLFKRGETAKEALDINEAIREVIALTRHQVEASRVVLRTELADGLPPVVGDRVQLQQVVLNLILNAAEAMSSVEGRHRELSVATLREGIDQVRVAVRDSGIGVDPKASERIFEAFYTNKRDGMGMGLSIARSIVESHGGRLWAMPNEGPGATFMFTLPRGSAPGEPAAGTR